MIKVMETKQSYNVLSNLHLSFDIHLLCQIISMGNT